VLWHHDRQQLRGSVEGAPGRTACGGRASAARARGKHSPPPALPAATPRGAAPHAAGARPARCCSGSGGGSRGRRFAVKPGSGGPPPRPRGSPCRGWPARRHRCRCSSRSAARPVLRASGTAAAGTARRPERPRRLGPGGAGAAGLRGYPSAIRARQPRLHHPKHKIRSEPSTVDEGKRTERSARLATNARQGERVIRARTVQLRNLLVFRRHTMPRRITIRHRLLHSPDSGAGAHNALAPSEAAVAVGGG